MNQAHPDSAADRLRVGGPRVAWRATGDEVVVLDLEGSVYFGLNGTASSLWRRLASVATRAELVALLQARGADQATAARDVDDFVAQLADHGLLSGEV